MASDHCEVSAGDLEATVEALDPQTAIKRVGRLLHTVVIAKDVSPACLSALERMAVSGEVFAVQFVDKLKDMWSPSEFCQVRLGRLPRGHVFELDKVAQCRGSMRCRHNDIEASVRADHIVVPEVTTELTQHLGAVHDALSGEDWGELCTRLADSTTTQWQSLAEATTNNVDFTTEETGLVTAEAIKVYNSPLALDALRGGGIAAVGTIAAFLARAGLPPLLRLEIARDYFQTVGLFFGGLYAAALDYIDQHHIASHVSRFLDGITSIYDVVSVNVVAVVKGASLSHALMIDIAMWLLIAAVASVYMSFLWFAISGRHLHRRQDEVRQGHEADTWVELATKQKTRVALFTHVITACLTVYLPLTRLCLEIVVEAATHRLVRADNYSGYTGSNGNTGTGYSGSSGGAYGGYTGNAGGYAGGTTGNNGGSTGGHYYSFINGTDQGPSNSTDFSFDDLNSSSSAGNDWDSSFVGFNGSTGEVESGVANVTTFTSTNTYGGLQKSASELVMDRFEGDEQMWYINIITATAVILLVTFTRQLPKILVGAVAENRPTGSLEDAKVTHDLDGEEVTFDDKVYERLVQRDPNQLRCPYRSLYAGFEQRWSYYKVLQLLIKLVLALVIVLTTNNTLVLRGVILLVFYAAVVLLTCYSTPFIDPLNNVMEISGEITALTTCIGGLVAANLDLSLTSSHSLEVVAIIVATAHIVNFFVMLVVLLLDMPGARLFVKNLLGWITFSDTCRGVNDAPAKNVLPLWSLEREVKHRVWHAIVASGIHRVRAHWHGEEDAHNTKLREVMRTALEGVDVYWDDATGTRDGHLDSNTCFGKMYVVPYPFHCAAVYDDCNDEAIIRDDFDDKKAESKLAKLLFLNFTPRIMVKRELRQKLRILSDHATRIDFPFSRLEQVTVPDGVIQTTDANGNTQTQPRFSTVTFTCYYTNGVIEVATKGDAKGRIMAEGFNVSMTYRDGLGKAVAPYTGMVEIWEAGVPELLEQHQQYRRELQIKHAQANATLTDSFWYFVYNDSHLSREKLEDHFKYRETNPRLKLLADTHQEALNSLYLRMKFIYSHPAVTFWYIFWDDVYTRNGDMKCLRSFTQDLDPRQPTSICYHVMRRPELEAWLRERKILGKRLLFHPLLLDILYDELDKHFGSLETSTHSSTPPSAYHNCLETFDGRVFQSLTRIAYRCPLCRAPGSLSRTTLQLPNKMNVRMGRSSEAGELSCLAVKQVL
ncbi:unnamed protein product [Phytophthora fragariaefolia]|uniref:Unnamed protein product n=1 Tax=Phytophthora fragariaefolia TaxID=1490495 RepID=A0A9W6YN13_9STRA|nr:unnamed protein product [Phytophthora fragariaefolia]